MAVLASVALAILVVFAILGVAALWAIVEYVDG
jgi:hypothetical protein